MVIHRFLPLLEFTRTGSMLCGKKAFGAIPFLSARLVSKFIRSAEVTQVRQNVLVCSSNPLCSHFAFKLDTVWLQKVKFVLEN